MSDKRTINARKTHACDLISRQDAINAIDALPNCYNGYSDAYDKSYIIGVLEELPSAEPETTTMKVGQSRNGLTMWYECEMCHEPVDEQDIYCRGCGRRFEHGLESGQYG